ncbi:MAG: hypothetical protein M3N98_02085 [Actinomycetota bacterium]|nr:hypothetical protein [Actinomycetota bacterium]
MSSPLRDAAGLAEVARWAQPVSMAGEQILPVLAALAPLLPEGGLRRGSTVTVRPSASGGSTALALALAAAASQAGSWCAAVGFPSLGLVAASGLGMALERLALVPHPGQQWLAVTAAMIDGVDLVLVRPPRGARSAEARRLMAKARERGSVLVPCGDGWPEGADLRLSVVGAAWQGLGDGHGFLRARRLEVVSAGRGAASRERRVGLWLPDQSGSVVSDRRTAGEVARPVSGVG